MGERKVARWSAEGWAGKLVDPAALLIGSLRSWVSVVKRELRTAIKEPPTSSSSQHGPAWNLPAAIAGWVLPGLGHLLIGDLLRGLILATAITLLWLGGLLIGGIGVVQARDAQDNFRPWFLGQMLIAPSLAVEYTHDSYRAQYGGTDPLPPDDGTLPSYTPSYGRPHEIGTLYTALAGLLNLLAIVDVIYRQPKAATIDATARGDRDDQPAGEPEAAAT